MRAGLNAVSRHVRQAALATGLTWWQAQRHVILPLPLRVIAPSLTSEFVTIFKGPSLAMTVRVMATAYVAQQVGPESAIAIALPTSGAPSADDGHPAARVGQSWTPVGSEQRATVPHPF